MECYTALNKKLADKAVFVGGRIGPGVHLAVNPSATAKNGQIFEKKASECRQGNVSEPSENDEPPAIGQVRSRCFLAPWRQGSRCVRCVWPVFTEVFGF
jgi:hypothetical protein